MVSKQRYYLNGDQQEGDHSKYFCAQCDQFVEAEHFHTAKHAGHNQTPYERYLRDLKRLPTYMKNTNGTFHRPKNAANCVA